MFITNCNLRKSLGMRQLLAPEDGAGNGGAGSDEGVEEKEDTKEDNPEEENEDKTFTQADVDKLIKDRVAREKKGQLSKD
ncbi:MAG: hypothetical protein RSC42_15160, partial [Clostridium sp.]